MRNRARGWRLDSGRGHPGVRRGHSGKTRRGTPRTLEDQRRVARPLPRARRCRLCEGPGLAETPAPDALGGRTGTHAPARTDARCRRAAITGRCGIRRSTRADGLPHQPARLRARRTLHSARPTQCRGAGADPCCHAQAGASQRAAALRISPCSGVTPRTLALAGSTTRVHPITEICASGRRAGSQCTGDVHRDCRRRSTDQLGTRVAATRRAHRTARQPAA